MAKLMLIQLINGAGRRPDGTFFLIDATVQLVDASVLLGGSSPTGTTLTLLLSCLSFDDPAVYGCKNFDYCKLLEHCLR